MGWETSLTLDGLWPIDRIGARHVVARSFA